MTQFISRIGNSIIGWLPQNQHSKEVVKINKRVDALNEALQDTTNTVFINKMKATTDALTTEKEKCLKTLDNLNGAYYQDPKSKLKQCWDKLIETVRIALGVSVQMRAEVNTILTQLNADSSPSSVNADSSPSSDKLSAKTAIEEFLQSEKTRDETEKQLEVIIAKEKILPNKINELTSERKTLEARHLELCGKYFMDTDGLLDQAWVKFQEAIKNGASDTKNLSDKFYKLEEERKQIENKLFNIAQQLSIPSFSGSIETLTIASIQEEIRLLEASKTTASGQSGIDWKRTAAIASAMGTTALSAGYIVASSI